MHHKYIVAHVSSTSRAFSTETILIFASVFTLVPFLFNTTHLKSKPLFKIFFIDIKSKAHHHLIITTIKMKRSACFYLLCALHFFIDHVVDHVGSVVHTLTL